MKEFFRRLMIHSDISGKEWESEYSKGSWSYLNSILELGHYSIIIGYIHFFEKSALVLDVGCGEGILQERLDKTGYEKYVGLDISEHAILKAKSKENRKTEFICSTADDFSTKEKFDTIVFNEVLYYLKNPVETVKRYEQFLNEKGIIIISMHVHRKSRSIWREIASFRSFADETKIINKKGTTWICKCYQKS